jgi:hypothetical protein
MLARSSRRLSSRSFRALLTDGAVERRGLNYSGWLGDGTTDDSPTPVSVIGIP